MRYHFIKELIQRHSELVGLKTVVLKLDEQSTAEFSEYCIQNKISGAKYIWQLPRTCHTGRCCVKEDIFFDLAAGDCVVCQMRKKYKKRYVVLALTHPFCKKL